MDNKTAEQALRWMIEDRGRESILDEKVVNSILSDLANDDEKSRNSIKLALSVGYGKTFFDVSENKDALSGGEVDALINKLINNGFNNEFAINITNLFYYAFFGVYIEGADRNKIDNVEDHKKESLNDDAKTMFEMGDRYENMSGETHDFNKAFEFYMKSAEKGYGEAQAKVGFYYLKGRGEVEKNDQEAMKWLQIAAANNNAKAISWIGDIYNPSAYGFDTSFGKDITKAMEFYSRAAEMGGYNGMMQLAQIYKYGGHGVSKDIDKSMMYYEKVANMNCNLTKLACRFLAEIYELRGDNSLAREWYKKAAALGDEKSAGILAGNDVDSEAVKAIKSISDKVTENAGELKDELLMGINDIGYDAKDGTVLDASVYRGMIEVGDEIEIILWDKSRILAKIVWIKEYGISIDYAKAGENVSISLGQVEADIIGEIAAVHPGKGSFTNRIKGVININELKDGGKELMISDQYMPLFKFMFSNDKECIESRMRGKIRLNNGGKHLSPGEKQLVYVDLKEPAFVDYDMSVLIVEAPDDDAPVIGTLKLINE